MCVLVAVAVFSMAGAASASEIKNNIDMAIQKQKEAHEIAEYVRGFGEAEDHPAILFAQEKWWEQQKILTKLYKDYEQAISQEESNGTYIGTFRISHYCPCSICNGGYSGTATGATLTPWYTIAVDPSVIKLNSTVYIDGYGEFKAQDTGSAIKGNRIDVCVSSHEEAYRLGVVYKDVYIK
jgi:3D (Asp-Asp-Asp) domain-containing protein